MSNTISTKKTELLNFIFALTPEEADKLVKRIDLLEKVVKMTDCQAEYSNRLAGKLFFEEGEGSQTP